MDSDQPRFPVKLQSRERRCVPVRVLPSLLDCAVYYTAVLTSPAATTSKRGCGGWCGGGRGSMALVAVLSTPQLCFVTSHASTPVCVTYCFTFYFSLRCGKLFLGIRADKEGEVSYLYNVWKTTREPKRINNGKWKDWRVSLLLLCTSLFYPSFSSFFYIKERSMHHGGAQEQRQASEAIWESLKQRTKWSESDDATREFGRVRMYPTSASPPLPSLPYPFSIA